MRIAIWGTGKAGQYIKRHSENKKEIDVQYFIDNDITKQNTYIDGMLVISVERLKELYLNEIDAVFIGVIDMGSVTSIILQLKNLGINQVGFLQSGNFFRDTLDWKQILWSHHETKPILPYLETNIMDSCNLKCKGCTHFANLFTEDSYIDFEVFRKDLHRVAENLIILQFRLLGGEPLLNSDLVLYIEEARQLMPKTDIRVVTNGILLPQQNKELFDCMKRNNIKFDISLYPPTLKMKNKLIEVLEKNEVEYRFSGEIKMFYKTLTKDGKSNPILAHENCCQKHCAFLRNGRIYKCPYESLIDIYKEYFHLEKEFVHERNLGMDLYSEELEWQQFIEYLQRPIDFCKYCAEKGGEFFLWKSSKYPEKEEWLIQNSTIKVIK